MGTVKSRLSRGTRENLRWAVDVPAASDPKSRPMICAAHHRRPHAGRAVPAGACGFDGVVCGRSRGGRRGLVPATVVALTRGVLISMFLSKSKSAAVTTAVAATLTAGAFGFAQTRRPTAPERRPGGRCAKMPPRLPLRNPSLPRRRRAPQRSPNSKSPTASPRGPIHRMRHHHPAKHLQTAPIHSSTRCYVDVGQAKTKATKDQARGPGTSQRRMSWKTIDKADQRRSEKSPSPQTGGGIVEHSKQERVSRHSRPGSLAASDAVSAAQADVPAGERRTN